MSSILDVFSEVLGKRCDNQVRDAWVHLGDFIAETLYMGYSNGKDAAELTNDSETHQINGLDTQQNIEQTALHMDQRKTPEFEKQQANGKDTMTEVLLVKQVDKVKISSNEITQVNGKETMTETENKNH